MGASASLVVAAGGLAVSIVLYRLVDHRERSHRVKPAKPTPAALVLKDQARKLRD
jgi:hypothetical protein